MRSLVVYHSHTGTTRKLAEAAARDLGADIVEVRASRYRRGIASYMRAAYDSVMGRLPEIDAGNIKPDSYDLVLLLAPLWAGRASTPMRAYLTQHRGKMRRAAFVLTCGGNVPPKAFEQMAAIADLTPERTFSMREKDLKAREQLPTVFKDYLNSLKLRRAA